MKIRILQLAMLAIAASMVMSCSDDDGDDDNNNNQTTEFVELESPYLICQGRNPNGVGFDFEYNGERGGANYMDSLSVEDFAYDTKVRTIKAEKPDGTLGGMPFFELSTNAAAVNYSSIDTTAKGYDTYVNLSLEDLPELTFESDVASFDLSTLPSGETGKPLMAELQAEYEKLVIGDKWKESAKNEVEGDELIWIIRTPEDRWVKLIVTDFPADPAPTATGYIAVTWDFIN